MPNNADAGLFTHLAACCSRINNITAITIRNAKNNQWCIEWQKMFTVSQATMTVLAVVPVDKAQRCWHTNAST